MASESADLHRVVVVGGGAGGLELVTRLGDKLGRRKRADITLIDKYRTHLWKPLLHEVAAGSMDLSVHEINFLAQAHWHHFHYRIGELIGLDRGKREVHLAAYFDDDGKPGDSAAQLPLRHAGHRVGQPEQRFRYSRCARTCDFARYVGAGEAVPQQASERLHPRARAIDAAAAGTAPCRDHRRRCHRERSWQRSCTIRRASSSLTASTGSTQKRISRSSSSKRLIASYRRCRCDCRQPPRNCSRISAYASGHHRK